ncbi:hypothetical protein [Alteromonas halophila]|uniref:PEP-CTERM sorting domain-containing protein n=1 Tax=Alteromonas halophila TaxID=516698 RepID=A0A918JLG8_9ALTE|nr:hypothetical protein [Alteromonas halophila]GGW88061.1 hypothetical protein GCM10007391_22270 [Alteromonas halophila]
MRKLQKNKLLIVSVVAGALGLASPAQAGLMTFKFSIGGFSNGGSVTGSFTGEDLNGDGYLSSFPFKQDVDFLNNSFSAGQNEITKASATFNGMFDGGASYGTVTNFTISHDLTDLTDFAFGVPSFLIDMFFTLNYNLNSPGTIGDDPFEGILLAPFDGSGVFGAGNFLPTTDLNFIFDSINDLPGGSTLTSSLINNNSNGAPCVNGATCGTVHTVAPDANGVPFVAGYDLTNALVQVTRVPTPGSLSLFGIGIIALLTIRRKAGVRRKVQLV